MEILLKNERVELLLGDKNGCVEIIHSKIILRFNLDGTITDNQGFTFFSTPLQSLINSIITCAFEGQARLFFLEAKALELVALYLVAVEQPPKKYVFCKSEYDQERLFFCKNIPPPTLRYVTHDNGTCSYCRHQ